MLNFKYKIGLFFVVCFLACTILIGQGTESLMVRALNDDNPEIRKAVKLLMSAGYVKNDVIESSSRHLGGSNCIFILKEEALRGSFVQGISNSQIKQINIRFVQGAIHVTGKVKALLVTRNFSVIIRPESDENNVVDFVLSKIQVSGINLKIFSGMMFNLIKNRMKKVFKDSVDFTDLGADSAGNRILRARIWPDFFSPTFGSPGNLNAIRISGTEFQVLVTLQ
ncbi:hypothetical protein KAJ27_10530 [bacterium]|nr:hypothetical protein [bacterium]